MNKEVEVINKKIKELKDKIWELQIKKRKLENRFGIQGCPNTSI